MSCQHEWGEYDYSTGYPRFIKDDKGLRCCICLIKRNPPKRAAVPKTKAPHKDVASVVGTDLQIEVCIICHGLGFERGKVDKCGSCKGSGVMWYKLTAAYNER